METSRVHQQHPLAHHPYPDAHVLAANARPFSSIARSPRPASSPHIHLLFCQACRRGKQLSSPRLARNRNERRNPPLAHTTTARSSYHCHHSKARPSSRLASAFEDSPSTVVMALFLCPAARAGRVRISNHARTLESKREPPPRKTQTTETTGRAAPLASAFVYILFLCTLTAGSGKLGSRHRSGFGVYPTPPIL